MNEKFGSSFEVGVSRHGPKKQAPEAEEDGFYADQIDLEKADKESEGIIGTLVEKILEAAPGSIFAFQPSNILRAEQTRELLVAKIDEQLRESERADIVLVESRNVAGKGEELLKEIMENPEKTFVITDLKATGLLGFKESDISTQTANTWKKLFNGDEDLIGKLWAAHATELPTLSDELKKAHIEVAENDLRPEQFETTPEELSLRQIRWMETMQTIGEKYFTGRPLFLEGISHSVRSDFAILSLLGEDISVKSIQHVLEGTFRNFFERSSVAFDDHGVRVEFRDKEKIYSKEEFSTLKKEIKAKSEARKTEWQASKDLL